MGLYRDNGKENGNYYSRLGLYRDNGKENGNYYSSLGLYGALNPSSLGLQSLSETLNPVNSTCRVRACKVLGVN